ncbi:MAG: MarR family winged helix-turn-helix transcriptional regulator [Actinomycetota bacterium]
MDPGRDGPQLEAWRAFLSGYRAVLDVLEDELKCARGLPLTWYDVLAQLNDTPGHRLRMKDLADSIMLSKSGLTRVVDRMVGADLVARESCPSDRRGYEAVLTPAGRRAFDEADPVHLEGIERHFSRYFSDAEARTLSQALMKLLHPGPAAPCP